MRTKSQSTRLLWKRRRSILSSTRYKPLLLRQNLQLQFLCVFFFLFFFCPSWVFIPCFCVLSKLRNPGTYKSHPERARLSGRKEAHFSYFITRWLFERAAELKRSVDLGKSSSAKDIAQVSFGGTDTFSNLISALILWTSLIDFSYRRLGLWDAEQTHNYFKRKIYFPSQILTMSNRVLHEHTTFCQMYNSLLFHMRDVCNSVSVLVPLTGLKWAGLIWEKGDVTYFCAPIRI